LTVEETSKDISRFASFESRISGDLGETIVQYLLARKGIETVHANTVGFDLFAIDSHGKIFDPGRTVGISVKTRLLKEDAEISDSIDISPSKVERMAKVWNVDPWVAIVAGYFYHHLFVFLFRLADWSDFKGRTKSEGLVSISSLQHSRSKRVLILVRPPGR